MRRRSLILLISSLVLLILTSIGVFAWYINLNKTQTEEVEFDSNGLAITYTIDDGAENPKALEVKPLVFSDIDRDIRGRVLSCSYLGLVDKNKIEADLKPNASFFKVYLEEKNDDIKITFDNDIESFTCRVKRVTDSFGIECFKKIENDYLAFDNLEVIMTSIKRLQSKINYTDIVFHMMPERFTLKELQLVYEAILDKKLLDPVFRRNISDLVIKTDEVRADGGHRPAALYKKKIED